MARKAKYFLALGETPEEARGPMPWGREWLIVDGIDVAQTIGRWAATSGKAVTVRRRGRNPTVWQYVSDEKGVVHHREV